MEQPMKQENPESQPAQPETDQAQQVKDILEFANPAEKKLLMFIAKKFQVAIKQALAYRNRLKIEKERGRKLIWMALSNLGEMAAGIKDFEELSLERQKVAQERRERIEQRRRERTERKQRRSKKG